MKAALRAITAPEICRACAGKCCRRLPGHAAPEDFGATKEEQVENVKVALRSGEWQLDWWEGEAELPVSKRKVVQPHLIRPKVLDGRGGIFNPTWGGACVFLADDGCRLSPEQRPFECRLLVPSNTGECKFEYVNKLYVAEMWLDAGINLEAIGRDVIREQDGPWGEERESHPGG
jgi:Fe-S-cluster containining protein